MNCVNMFSIIMCVLLSVGLLEGKSVSSPFDEQLSEYLKEVLENFRDEMKNGLPEIGVPVVDPLAISNIDKHILDELAVLDLRMEDIRVMGLSGFVVKELKADLEDGFVSVSLDLSKLHIDGLCYMNGNVLNVFPLSSDGNFSIDVQDIQISGQGLFHIYKYKELGDDKIKIRLSDLILDLTFGPLHADFEKVVGDGRWTQTLIKILRGNDVGLFKLFHQTAMAELDKILIRIINKELNKFELSSLLGKNQF